MALAARSFHADVARLALRRGADSATVVDVFDYYGKFFHCFRLG